MWVLLSRTTTHSVRLHQSLLDTTEKFLPLLFPLLIIDSTVHDILINTQGGDYGNALQAASKDWTIRATANVIEAFSDAKLYNRGQTPI